MTRYECVTCFKMYVFEESEKSGVEMPECFCSHRCSTAYIGKMGTPTYGCLIPATASGVSDLVSTPEPMSGKERFDKALVANKEQCLSTLDVLNRMTEALSSGADLEPLSRELDEKLRTYLTESKVYEEEKFKRNHDFLVEKWTFVMKTYGEKYQLTLYDVPWPVRDDVEKKLAEG